jgi:hypothetical protein
MTGGHSSVGYGTGFDWKSRATGDRTEGEGRFGKRALVWLTALPIARVVLIS